MLFGVLSQNSKKSYFDQSYLTFQQAHIEEM